MSQNKQVGMSNIREKKMKDLGKTVLRFLLMFLPSLYLQPHRVPAGIVLPKEAAGMVFLAISLILVHEG